MTFLREAVTLYVVATPLGNLHDLSPRAAEVLQRVQIVAAEDTRRARILLGHVGAKPRVLSYHAHSPDGRLEQLERALMAGQDVALLSDAGTPAVSDPGAALVARALALSIPVVAVAGPSAVTAALSVSGFPADRYTFLGFLPRKGKERRALLTSVATSPLTVVLFESPNRLTTLLTDLRDHCGSDRRATVARELTKLHEECRTGTLADLEGYYREHSPRGEVTIIIAGEPPAPQAVDEAEARRRATAFIREGMSRRDAATRLAGEFSMSRREAYRMVTEL